MSIAAVPVPSGSPAAPTCCAPVSTATSADAPEEPRVAVPTATAAASERRRTLITDTPLNGNVRAISCHVRWRYPERPAPLAHERDPGSLALGAILCRSRPRGR